MAEPAEDVHPLTTRARQLVGPLAATAALLLQVLVGLAELRRPLFIVVSAIAIGVLIILVAWYAFVRHPVKAGAAFLGVVLVGLLAWFGAPSDVVSAGGGDPPGSPDALNDAATSPGIE